MYEVLISHLRDCAKYDQYENTFAEAADAIEELEAVNQRQLLEIAVLSKERKTGKWIYPSDITGFGRCSECKSLWDYSLIANKYFKICPRCGSYNGGNNDV